MVSDKLLELNLKNLLTNVLIVMIFVLISQLTAWKQKQSISASYRSLNVIELCLKIHSIYNIKSYQLILHLSPMRFSKFLLSEYFIYQLAAFDTANNLYFCTQIRTINNPTIKCIYILLKILQNSQNPIISFP